MTSAQNTSLQLEFCFLVQFLGFGAESGEKSGRRAATQGGMNEWASGDDADAEADLKERDEMLKAVEARDLIEFGQ